MKAADENGAHDTVVLPDGGLVLLDTFDPSTVWYRGVQIGDVADVQAPKVGAEVEFTLPYKHLILNSSSNDVSRPRYSMQWQVSKDGAEWENIGSSTISNKLKVSATAENIGYFYRVSWKSDFWSQSGFSEAGQLIAPDLPVATVVVEGDLVSGQTVEAVVDGWDSDTTVAYEWFVSDKADGSDSQAIAGATGSTLVLTDEMIGKFVQAKVAGSNAIGSTGTAEATFVGPVVAPAPTELDPAVATVNGKLFGGETLTSTVSGWKAGTTVAYEWLVSDKADGSNPRVISGETGSSMVLRAAQVGKYVSVRATGSVEGGASGVATAAFRGPVKTTVLRVSGDNRFETSSEVVKKFPSKKGGIMFVASGMVFADALSVAPAAAVVEGSLVLTRTNDLGEETRQAILDANPAEIIIVGGESTISDRALNQIKSLVGSKVKVDRLGGVDRYDTSKNIYEEYFAKTSGGVAFIATGVTYADALAGAPLAAVNKAPILLVKGAAPGEELKDAAKALKNHKIADIRILGGKASVSDKVVDVLKTTTGVSATRINGDNRYETAVKIGQGFPSVVENVWVASGSSFPDALSAAVPAALNGSPIYLSPQSCLSVQTLTAINAHTSAFRITVGGTATLSDQVMNLIACK